MSHCLNKRGDKDPLLKTDAPLRYGQSKAAPASKGAAAVYDEPEEVPVSKGVQTASDAAHEAILRSVAKAIQEKIHSKASESDQLLSEHDTVQATAVYAFSWQRAGDHRAAGDTTPTEPQAVSFSKTDLGRMFQGKVSFERPQYVHSAYITDVYNSAPYPIAFTMEGIQNGVLEREFCNDGSASTMLLLPRQVWSGEKEVYRLRDVDPEALRTHGNADLKEEVDSLTAVPDSDHVLVRPMSRIGRILKKNEHLVSDTGVLEVLDAATIPMYAVKESRVLEILDLFNKNVISSLPKTDFTQHSASLRRADRTAKENSLKEFADASDAPNMSRAALDAAHREKHTVIVKVRFNVIDPAKLERKETPEK